MAIGAPSDVKTGQQSEVRIPHGLLLDGEKSYISVSHIPFDDYDAFTVEAWVYGWEGRIFNQGFRGDPENSIWMSLGAMKQTCGWESTRGENHARPIRPTPKQMWEHVAMVFDGKQQRVYLNGKLVYVITAPKPGPLRAERKLIIGARQQSNMALPNPIVAHAKGVLGPFRISKTARYAKDFTPDKEFKADADTIILLILDERKGTKAADSSENGRHGVVYDAKWIGKGQSIKDLLK